MNGKDIKRNKGKLIFYGMGRTAFTEVKERRSYRYSRDIMKEKEKWKRIMEKETGKGKIEKENKGK